jgi:hypothetical protein
VLTRVTTQATEQDFKVLLDDCIARVRQWKATQPPAAKPSLIVVARPVLTEIGVAVLAGAALVWTLFKPDVLEGVSRVVILFVLAMFIAIVITNRLAVRVAARLDRRTALSAVAASLLVAIPLFLLVELTDGAQRKGQTVVLHVNYDDDRPVLWFTRDLVKVVPESAAFYIDNNTLVVRFPKGVREATLTLKDDIKDVIYSRTISNEKEESTLIMPTDFKSSQ